jgi:8-amino-7-oxononanoate synthase
MNMPQLKEFVCLENRKRNLDAELKQVKQQLDDLERVLGKLPPESSKLVVSDGVFSTSGTIVDLPNLVKAAKKHNARILIDDAHATGVIGKGGRGTASSCEARQPR